MFYERLKAARKEKGLTQEQLARALCLERSAVGKYESEKANTFPSADILSKLSDILGVSIDYLLGKTDNKNKPTANDGDGLPKEMQEFMSFYDELDEDRQHKLLEIARLYRDDQRKTSDNK